ncbi:MAG TPA: hypothetical protein VFZ89_00230 [Solirubrobacteraceae bacterium]
MTTIREMAMWGKGGRRTAVLAAVVAATTLTAPEAFAARGKVVRVVDGDSVRIRTATGARTFNLRGVDAPDPGACYAQTATNRLRSLLPVGTRVRTQGSGRSVFLFKGATFINRSLIHGGYAEWTERGSSALDRRLDSAEDSAANAKRGLWGACTQATQPGGGGTPPPAPPPPPPPPPPSGQTTRMSLAQWQAFLNNSLLTSFSSSNTGTGSSTRRDFTLCAGGAYAYRSETSSADFNTVYTETGTWRIVSIARRADLVADEARVEFITQQSSGDVAPGTKDEAFMYSYDDGRFRIGNTPTQKGTASNC